MGSTPTKINLYYYCGLLLVNSGDRYSTYDNITSQTITSSGSMTFYVESGLAYTVNQVIVVSNNLNYMNANVVAYNKLTGQLDITINSSNNFTEILFNILLPFIF